jgi:S-DNA-T family DNA segregation ATPase FtsK/SpoIIIE
MEQLEIVGDATDRLVLIDDIDSLLARFGSDHRAAFIERLGRLLRDGPARGIRFVLAAQRLTADAQALAALAPSRIMLRHATRQDHVLAGGDGQQFVAELPPGGGVWRGHRVQIASGAEPSAPSAPAAPAAVPDDSRPLAIVSTRTASLLGRLATLESSVVVELAAASGDHRELAQPHHGRRPIVLGDVDEWQSRWGALSALRPFADILFDGCSVADFRALTRSRELPPPLSSDRGLCWKLNDDGTASRARLPGG